VGWPTAALPGQGLKFALQQCEVMTQTQSLSVVKGYLKLVLNLSKDRITLSPLYQERLRSFKHMPYILIYLTAL
jgi:hypothetical protein